jgi:hypothetical protein
MGLHEVDRGIQEGCAEDVATLSGGECDAPLKVCPTNHIEWGRMSQVKIPKNSRMFREVPESSRTYWNTLECSRMFWNVLELCGSD